MTPEEFALTMLDIIQPKDSDDVRIDWEKKAVVARVNITEYTNPLLEIPLLVISVIAASLGRFSDRMPRVSRDGNSFFIAVPFDGAHTRS